MRWNHRDPGISSSDKGGQPAAMRGRERYMLVISLAGTTKMGESSEEIYTRIHSITSEKQMVKFITQL